MRNEWSGDVDLGDGSLQQLHTEYTNYLQFIRNIGTSRKAHHMIKEDLQKLKMCLSDEVKFLREGHDESKTVYENKRTQFNVSEESLFALAWDVEGFSKLVQMNTSLTATVNNLIELITNKSGNILSILQKTRNELQEYVKGLFSKKRHAASHLLLFMISDERRNFKEELSLCGY